MLIPASTDSVCFRRDTLDLTWYTQAIVELPTQRAIGYEWLTRPTQGPSATALWAWAGKAQQTAALSWVSWEAAATCRADHPGLLFLNADPVMLDLVPRFIRHHPECDPWVLELTERALPSATQWQQLLQWSIDLAIDDFGMGDDFLGKLLDWPVQWLKLDRSIVQRCATTPPYRTVVAYLLTIARDRQIAVIAEGIETAAEYAAMQALGIAYGQGYRWGRPRKAYQARWTLPPVGQALDIPQSLVASQRASSAS